MGEPSAAAIETRAKLMCEEDGAQWEPEMQIHPGKKFLPLVRTMDDVGREQYRAKARAQLVEECPAQG